MRSIRAGQVIAAGQYYVSSLIGRNGAPVRSNGFNRPTQHLDLSARGNHFAPMPASAIAHKRPYRTQELDRSFVFSIVSRLDPNVLHKQPLSRKGASRNLVVDMTRETTQFDELGLVRTASRIAARSLMLVAILVAAYSTAYATTYSVSPPPVGNDANDGSEAAPFATI